MGRRCGYCSQPVSAPYAIVHVEDEANRFMLTVCDECGKLAEALFKNDRDFPGLEIN